MQPITKKEASARLAVLRQSIKDENISYSEIAELQSLAPYIDPSDTELLEWAGVPEGEKMDYLRACDYLQYLEKTGQAFCYLPNGELITREYCTQLIEKHDQTITLDYPL